MSSLTWGLREVLQYAEVLLNKDDVDAKADALIDFIRERVVDRDVQRSDCSGTSAISVASFADLEAWFRDVLRALERKNDRELADAPRRDDPKGAEPPLEHLDALRRTRDRRRGRERPPVRELSGSHGVRHRRRLASRRTRRI